MTPSRFERYDRALASARCDAYLSAGSADVFHLTGSEDGNAFVVYQPGQLPSIVVRASGYNCTAESAQAKEIAAFDFNGPVPVLTRLLRAAQVRRIAVGSLDRELVEQLAADLPDLEIVATPRLGRDLRRVKESTEVELLERAAACVGSGIEAGLTEIRPGRTDREVAAAIAAGARRAGADSISFLQVKSGPRAAFPDADPVGRPFGTGEVGFIDMGISHRSYRGDYTRAFIIGRPSDEALRVVEVVDRIQRQVVALVRPGLACRDLYRQARELFADAGYPEAIPHHLGHGIGIGDDSLPMIVPTSPDAFLEGEVVCIEPGVYLPGLGGARIEDTLLVRNGAPRLLSHVARITHC